MKKDPIPEGIKIILSIRNNPKINCHVSGKYLPEKDQTNSNNNAAKNTAGTLKYPASIDMNTNSPEVVQYVNSGSICPNAIPLRAPPIPPNPAAIVKFNTATLKAEDPRYSTRSSFSLTANAINPGVES